MLISLPFWAETAAQLVEVEHLLLFDAPLSRALCGLEKDSGEDRNASQQLTVWLVGFCLGLSFCFKQMFWFPLCLATLPAASLHPREIIVRETSAPDNWEGAVTTEQRPHMGFMCPLETLKSKKVVSHQPGHVV